MAASEADAPARLLRPCLEKIVQQATGRRYAKLQQDAETLLHKLDVFLGVERVAPAADVAASRNAAPAAGHAAESAKPVAVALQEDVDGGVSLQLSVSPPPEALAAATEDPGHMPPASPLSGSKAGGPPVRRAGALADGAAREMLLVLRDAVDTRKPVFMEVALDAIQKLVAFKLLQGPVHSINHKREAAARAGEDAEDASSPLQFAAQPPQAQAVELMCACDDSGDEAVELRCLKALLTAVTAPSLTVHGQALLLVVRACYNVYLTSRSDVNQTTAKATLTQALNVLFQRMEAGSTAVVVPPIAVADMLGLRPAETSNMADFVQQFLHDVALAVDPFGAFTEGVQAGLDDAFAPGGGGGGIAAPRVEPSVSDLYDASDPADAQRIRWREPAAVAAAPEADTSPYRAAATDGGSDTASGVGAPPEATLQATLRKDAFLVFRALCKLSTRSPDGSAGSEVATLRGKLLALELLKVLLENAGPTFRSGDRFVGAIKQYLCLSLLKNCTAAAPQAQRLCASIFLTLLARYRSSLKAEIGVFFPMIFLRPIEAPTGGVAAAAAPPLPAGGADASQRALVLRCLKALCSDGQLLVDIFVNYDCDLGGANLFERMVAAVVRIAQGGHPGDASAADPQTLALRYDALRCLASSLRALATWHDATIAAGSAAALARVAAARAPTAAALPDEHVLSNGGGGGGGGRLPAGLGVADERTRSKWIERLAQGGGDAGGPALPGEVDGRKPGELLDSWKAFKRAFELGVAAFNAKPRKGVAYMQEQRLVGGEAEDVAKFLATTRGLDKAQVGDYLGEREEFNLRVMHAYVDALDFEGLDFDEAIRKFLSGFRLPGEAQKIDRLMEKFAARYVSCNPDAFRSADVAYVLAYSVIMLNTDAHNPMVKNKMTKADFLRNNRGINDGGDVPAPFMEALYDRIVSDEIKMKDDPAAGGGEGGGAGGSLAALPSSAGWLDTIMALIPGRQRAAAAEPTEESIKRTHDYLREQAKGATFFEMRGSEAVRPMLDVAWAPMLGAFSVLFEEEEDEYFVACCLDGFVFAIALASRLRMRMLQNTFVSSLARFTMLHSPGAMRMKHAQALRALLVVAEHNGNALGGDGWQDVLRCVSRFELLQQLSTGLPTDALLFATPATPEKGAPGWGRAQRPARPDGVGDGSSSIADMGLQAPARRPSATGKDPGLPPLEVLRSVDAQELNRLFFDSGRLDSDAVVDFVATLCSVAREELRPGAATPRVFSLTKIVEMAHVNMGRIRLVWARIWALLADFFVDVGCHPNLQVAMYAVDSLRQLAMKFLERDELANYTFQNDFLRPFVVLMRHSRAAEIRELIIRCVSQMILARVANVKSGWKSMFMVFTAAASDESPHIVRLAFDTVEKIVREHFHYITETETTTFTDCVNCLIAFTNNPHSLDVSLNAIAFLRFCAIRLAEGDVGMELGVGGLPEGATAVMDPNAHRIRPRGHDAGQPRAAPQGGDSASPGGPLPEGSNGGGAGVRIRFTDKDEHMYFWFPLLAGLGELTFDPRPEIRHGALGVLFDILKFHGASFTPQFWSRVYDSVLLPMFDHVRAEVTDTTTFTDEARRAEADAWLYEACTATLQHIVDIVVRYHAAVPTLMERTLGLLGGLIRRPHQALAAVGVAALARLAVAAGGDMDAATWAQVMGAFTSAAGDTLPEVGELIQHRMARRAPGSPAGGRPGASEIEPVMDDQAALHQQQQQQQLRRASGSGGSSSWSLGKGAGARRLAEVRCRAGVQLLLVQACSEVYAAHSRGMPPPAAAALLDVLRTVAEHAIAVDADVGLRHSLLLAQAADSVPPDHSLPDPPLLRLEVEAAQAYLSALLQITATGSEGLQVAGEVEARLVALCQRNLERYEQQSLAAGLAAEAEHGGASHGAGAASAAGLAGESEALAPLAVATLKALLTFAPEVFRAHLRELFPLLTNLISCEQAPPEVQRVLSELFAKRIGSLVV